MPNISEEKVGNSTARVTVTIPYSEYGPKVKKELAEYQKKAAFKGFRPGKTPMSFIQKMYGQQVIANKMNNILQDSMTEYLEDKKILGQPIPVDEITSFNLNSKQDYDFIFEIGLQPVFELNLVEEMAFNREIIWIDEKFFDKELYQIRHRNSEVDDNGEEVTSDDDMLKVRLKEMEEDTIKEGGVTSESYLSVDLLATEDLKKQVIGLKAGDTFTAKYTEISKEFDENRIKRYILKLEQDRNGEYPEVNEFFQVEILSIRQVKIAELNQAFFDKIVGVSLVETEEEFNAVFNNNLLKFLQQEANIRLFNEIQKTLIAQNDIELPEAFLKKWMVFTSEDKTEEEIHAEMPEFIESLKWKLIKDKIIKSYNLKVSSRLLKESIKNQLAKYMQGQLSDDILNILADQALNSDDEKMQEIKERAVQDALESIIFDKLETLVTINETEIPASDFNEILMAEYEAKLKNTADNLKEIKAIETENVEIETENVEIEIEEEIEEANVEIEMEEVVSMQEEEMEEVVFTEEIEYLTAEIDAEVENIADEVEQEIVG